MRGRIFWAGLVLALLFGDVPAVALAQATFEIPFKFKVEGKNWPAGEYEVKPGQEGQLLFRQLSTGKEILVPFLEKLTPPSPPVSEPRLVFDEVGDFAPSYTEYFTVYVLSEIWLSAADGFLVHVTKGAHNHKTISGVKLEK